MRGSKTKSRTFRRIQKRTPTNRLTTHFIKRNARKPICGNCGAILHGIKHSNKSILKKLSKTQKRPERPFGGVLCSKCSREKIKSFARSLK